MIPFLMPNYFDISVFISVSSSLILFVKNKLKSLWLDSRAFICLVLAAACLPFHPSNLSVACLCLLSHL